MKTFPLIIILTIFSIVLLTNCQEEPLEAAELASQTELAKKDFTDFGTLETESGGLDFKTVMGAPGMGMGMGMGMGGGTDTTGGGGKVVYQLTYIGFLTNGMAYALETTNNKKREAMDIAGCGKSYEIDGIDSLYNSVEMDCDYPTPLCVFNNGINHNKSKQNPGRVRAHIQFDSPAQCNTHDALWMFGYIYIEIDGELTKSTTSTIYPTGDKTVTIIFDKWWLLGCSESCLSGTQDMPNYFSASDVPGGIGEQILEITIAQPGETCASISPCPN